jgi:four helix bundle protein
MDTGKEMGLEQLKTWQIAMEFAVKICRELLPTFPADERFGLNSQLSRSAQSIPSNIAEGYGRFYFQEGIRFCYMARGSLEETRNHLVFAWKMGYITETIFKQYEDESKVLSRMINGYISYLKKTKLGENEYGNSGEIHEESTLYQVVEDTQPD